MRERVSMNDYDKYSFVSQQKIDRGGHVLALCCIGKRQDYFPSIDESYGDNFYA